MTCARRSLLAISGREADMRTTPAIAVIGLAGFLGVAACGARVQVRPVPVPSAAPMNSDSLAREIATIVVGKGGLTALTPSFRQIGAPWPKGSTWCALGGGLTP